MKVQLFIPCFIDQLSPQTAFNTIKVLEKAGCEVHYPIYQTCCGQPAYHAGYWEEAEPILQRFKENFNSSDYIVSPGGSCVGFLRQHVDQNDGIPIRIYELAEFLVDVLQIKTWIAAFEGIATYHDACGALRTCGIKAAPRRLLAAIKGLELRETVDCEVCCGFGGIFSLKFESIAMSMAEQKVRNALACGAKYIISTDYSCLLHLNRYIEQHMLPLQTIHFADILASE